MPGVESGFSVTLSPTERPNEGMAPQIWPWTPGADASQNWCEWARETAAWLQQQGVSARDVLVTVPVGALLAPARQAWGEAVGGWLPRIDTIAGVAEGLGWAREAPVWPEAVRESFHAPVSLDAVRDRLEAARSLGAQPWARQWAMRDRRGFEFALDQVVDAAQTWVRTLQGVAPAGRAERVAHWRETMTTQVGRATAQGAGGREGLLLSWALEWAVATADAGFPADGVYGLRPAAWVGVTAGVVAAAGSEIALMRAAMVHVAQQGVPVRWVAATPVATSERDALGASQVAVDVSLTACADALSEARQAAAQVIEAVNLVRSQRAVDTSKEGIAPVALIALDRGVVRHARALLDEAGVALADETGWLLSTTRAASVCTRLLTASNPRASTDELLDWLKSGWVSGPADEGALFTTPLPESIGALEVWCRRHGLMSAWSLVTDLPVAEAERPPQAGARRHQGLPESGRALWLWARDAVEPLQTLWAARRSTLWQWLQALHAALTRAGAAAALQGDAAGALAWSALSLDVLDAAAAADAGEGLPGLHALYRDTRMDGAGFARWVGEVLEDVTFRPPSPAMPEVVITTLARAVLRRFSTVVMPGADAQQLGALATPGGWLGRGLRDDMGLATPEQSRQAQWEAFQLVMTRPCARVIHRQAQGGAPLEVSPWLERWAQAQSVSVQDKADARPLRQVPVATRGMPAPSLHEGALTLPAQISATRYDALRQCPYRFFAQTLLGLRDQDELEEGLAHADHGSWLHEVLRRFHAEREARRHQVEPDEEVRHWLEVAHRVAIDMGFERDGQRAYFMPYQASLPDLARAYVGWMREHEAEGWSLRATEVELSRALDLGEGLHLRLFGQLDRVDVSHRDGTTAQQVLDYKTGNAVALKSRAASGSEDTQLAFYAALSGDEPPVQAAYVHLDAKAVSLLAHPDVAQSAAELVEGLSRDWQRLHQGAPMPALGEGVACGYCDARGLCRKDHWVRETPARPEDKAQEASA